MGLHCTNANSMWYRGQATIAAIPPSWIVPLSYAKHSCFSGTPMPRLSDTPNAVLTPSRRGTPPRNAASSAAERARTSSAAAVCARRAGCVETRSSGSTEARRSKPLQFEGRSLPRSNPGVLSDTNCGGGATRTRPRLSVFRHAGRDALSGCKSPQGARSIGVQAQRGPFNLSRRGEFSTGDSWDRDSDQSRRSGVRRSTAKSSTTRGPKGLAGESERRRCRTAQTCCRWVRGSFSFLPAEIARSGHSPLFAETMPPGRADIRQQAGGKPPGDVTVRMKRIANSGRTGAAGVMPGVLRGPQGD